MPATCSGTGEILARLVEDVAAKKEHYQVVMQQVRQLAEKAEQVASRTLTRALKSRVCARHPGPTRIRERGKEMTGA